LGWIAVNVIVSAHLGGSVTPNFLFTGGVLAILLAVYSLTLPDTPPAGDSKGSAPFGLDALGVEQVFADQDAQMLPPVSFRGILLVWRVGSSRVVRCG